MRFSFVFLLVAIAVLFAVSSANEFVKTKTMLRNNPEAETLSRRLGRGPSPGMRNIAKFREQIMRGWEENKKKLVTAGFSAMFITKLKRLQKNGKAKEAGQLKKLTRSGHITGYNK